MRKTRSDAVRSFYVALGRKITQAREGKKITQDGLAKEVGLARTSIVNIERGKQQLLFHTWMQIARALKVDPSELMPDTVPMEHSVEEAISHFVADPLGRAWIESSLGKGGANGH